MTSMLKKFTLFSHRFLLISLLLATLGILTGSVTNAYETVFLSALTPSVRMGFLAFLVVLIVLLVLVCYRWLERISERAVGICTVLMFAVMAGIFLILLVQLRPIPSTDQLFVTDKALEILQTGQRPIDPEGAWYFGQYSNNYFITILFVYYLKIWTWLGAEDLLFPLYLLDIAGILLAAFFTWLTAVMTGGLRRGAKVLLLCVMNPVYYFLAFWVYTTTLSVPFVMGSLCLGICIYKAKTVRQEVLLAIGEGICCAVGYFIRPTAVIPLIALLICGVLFGLKKESGRKLLRCGLVFLVTVLLLFKGISALNHSYFSTVEDGNFPVTHWLMMASHGDGSWSAEDEALTASLSSAEERARVTLEKTVEHYKALRRQSS